MLFNSNVFIFLFLPLTVFGFYLIGERGHHRTAAAWLVAASLVFYSWWNPPYAALLIGSILFNYFVGLKLSSSTRNKRPHAMALAIGVAVNLATLGYFKYMNFFIENFNFLGGDLHVSSVILPLGISFFTFQQIAYLVDAHRGEVREPNFLRYSLFVSFFPQLIAGPIVHHKEMMPQFAKDAIYRVKAENIARGLTIFFIGLFKKVILADGIALYATPVFSESLKGTSLSFLDSWGGALAYSMQLYFDFSGYADMAIGIALLFGIKIALNFNSPYKSVNIIEFWRNWHMTLSRFLRDYLYFPLGGNRRGKSRRYLNLMITMLLGGLWHGAEWSFVVWGGLHGLFVVVNHFWRYLRSELLGHTLTEESLWGRATSRALTFAAVVAAWVFFRAETLDSATGMLHSMFGFGEAALSTLSTVGPFATTKGTAVLVLLLIIAHFFPNTQEFMEKERAYAWRPSLAWLLSVIILGFISLYTIVYKANTIHEFLYFNF
ncbi:MAG: MBOAT family protein [Thermodesulfobacteriota bacterium]